MARTSSFLARPDCKRANATVSAGFGAAAKSWWVPRRSYTVQRGGGAQRRREAEGGGEISGSRSTWDNLFSQQRRGLCTRNRQAVQRGGAPATPGLIHGLWRGAGGVARLPTSRDTQHLPPHPQGTKGKRLVGRNPAQPVPCRTLQCESQGWGL